MIEIFIVLYLTALSCSALGSILVIKNESMIADALSHSILLGIVLGFFITHNLDSWLLIFIAAIFGLITIFLIEYLMKSSKINHDSATGLVFPLFFSIAVILISMYIKNVHLDVDVVLMGEILFIPLNRISIFTFSFPVALIHSIIVLILNALFLCFAYHRLKLYLFDEIQAQTKGVNIFLLKVAIIFLTAFTSVVAFNIVGSISVIAFLVASNMCSLFMTKNYGKMLLLNLLFSLIYCTVGYIIAIQFDLNIAGSVSFTSLILCITTIMLNKIKIKFTKKYKNNTIQ